LITAGQRLIAPVHSTELQLSTDDFAGHLANQTNLAIKGIIGIAAMGKIQEILGNTAAAQNYSVRLSFWSSSY
jgi:predicted nucleic acid-binding protein